MTQDDGTTHYLAPIQELAPPKQLTIEASFGQLRSLLGEPNTTELENCSKISASWAFVDDQGRKGFVWAYEAEPETCTRWSAAGDLELLTGLIGGTVHSHETETLTHESTQQALRVLAGVCETGDQRMALADFVVRGPARVACGAGGFRRGRHEVIAELWGEDVALDMAERLPEGGPTLAQPLGREDFSPTVRDMLNAAVRMHLIDPLGLALLVAEHRADSEALLSSLDDVAADGGPTSAWRQLRDAVVWLTELDEGGAWEDRFGFRGQTRAKMLANVERWAVRV